MPRNILHFLLQTLLDSLKVMALICVVFFLFALVEVFAAPPPNNEQCTELTSLSDGQFAVLLHAYEVGNPHGYGYSMAAIALQETRAGQQMVNFNDPSFGPFQVTVSNIVHYAGGGDVTDWQRDRLIERMMFDVRFSAETAFQVLMYWDSYHKRNNTFNTQNEYWRNLWASYNQGIHFRNTNGQAYADNITRYIRLLRNCAFFEYASL